MKLALYKGKGLPGNAITRFWTKSIYSHCELVIGDYCYSASFMDGGVRKKQINLNSGRWDVFDIPWADEEHALDFFEKTKGSQYDWLGIFGSQMLNRRSQHDHRFFCSEWVGDAVKIPTPEIHSPHTIGLLCEYLNTGVKKCHLKKL